jgi:hypothetical protein
MCRMIKFYPSAKKQEGPKMDGSKTYFTGCYHNYFRDLDPVVRSSGQLLCGILIFRCSGLCYSNPAVLLFAP